MTLKEDFPIRQKISSPTLPKTASAKGDDIVDWVQNQLINLGSDKVVEVIDVSGISNSQMDLIISTKENDVEYIRGIQVKTLSKCNGLDNYWGVMTSNQTYPDDTLMVFVNLAKTIYVLGFWKEFIIDYTSIKFNRLTQGQWFMDVEPFKVRLLELILKSPAINFMNTIKGFYQRQEFNSIRTIKEIVEKRRIRFEYHWTSDSPIDVYLNDHTCQCKTTTFTDGQLYTFSILKRVNGERVPYSERDVEYFIMQICTHEYKKDICIIPSKVLADQKRIKSDNSEGKIKIALAPPNHYEYHWSDYFWNNFNLITDSIVKDPVYHFILNNRCCVRNSSNIRPGGTYRFLIKDYDLDKDYIVLFLNNRSERLYKGYVFIIPIRDMINNNKTPVIGIESKRWTEIAPPDFAGSHWSLKYWNKISGDKLEPFKEKSNAFPMYVPIETSNPMIREADQLQYELDSLENVNNKLKLKIDVKEIMNEKGITHKDIDPLMRSINILRGTIDTLKIKIKGKQAGFDQ